jgi:hypothetical protein
MSNSAPLVRDVGGTSVDFNNGYPSWKQDGKGYHVNLKLGGSKKGKEMYHVTDESVNPKLHYNFYYENGDITDAVSGHKNGKKFSQLPAPVQKYVRDNIGSLLSSD